MTMWICGISFLVGAVVLWAALVREFVQQQRELSKDWDE